MHEEDSVGSISRRDALSILAGVAVSSTTKSASTKPGLPSGSSQAARSYCIRTLTAGTHINSFADTGTVEKALDFLATAKRRFEAQAYEVQTIRIALNPLLAGTSSAERIDALPKLIALDKLATARGALISLGPVFTAGDVDAGFESWATQLVRETRITSFSGSVASAQHGIHRDAIQMAARTISALAEATAGGLANFRFAAAALIPPGTPFFPVGYHEGAPSLAVGIESANLVREAFSHGGDPDQASERLRALMNSEFTPIEVLARSLALQGRRRYVGIDSSTAPGREGSIGVALEALTGQPFGAASTLQACAAVTAAIKSLDISTCGYSGLMLPILEDPVLAARAAEGRIQISDLLLYSTVCGTGLDLVPVPGNSTPADLARVIGDVATLAVRLRKPLSARLYPVPGKKAGDDIEFSDPLLCPSKVLKLEP